MNRPICDADDFYINMSLNTEMELPTSRDTVLHYFEQMRKAFPDLQNFFTRESGELVLEGNKEEEESYRWLSIEPKRLRSGQVNPESTEDAYRQHELVLEIAPHLLTISVLDCEALDLMYGFDFNYEGNHDEIVAEALGLGQGLEGVLESPGARVINYEPSVTLALDESFRLQCRTSVETRTNAYQVRTGDFPEDQISVYFTIRQYWGAGPDQAYLDAFRRLREVGEELVQTKIIPRIVQPLAQAIASR
ncbi:hypothetical protein SAMN05444166_5401 [Singulisphaera sp. GP187]|uniref:hypothetical protein n=1 Tax=Singulisphaera sp. GP187 TaxID=1882752 RepID=UPI0009285850|nr:hypothetical protein [Singulisphaera sp. GP187]SIO57427.1 hypothetical protein SAMN05444166_5401 [Singulisphaera sp. GP187]